MSWAVCKDSVVQCMCTYSAVVSGNHWSTPITLNILLLFFRAKWKALLENKDLKIQLVGIFVSLSYACFREPAWYIITAKMNALTHFPQCFYGMINQTEWDRTETGQTPLWDLLSLLCIQTCLIKTYIGVVHVVNNESHQRKAESSGDGCHDWNSQHSTVHVSLLSTWEEKGNEVLDHVKALEFILIGRV